MVVIRYDYLSEHHLLTFILFPLPQPFYQNPTNPRERQLKNDKYDEAVEISQSLDQSNNYAAAPKPRPAPAASAKGSSPVEEEAKGMTKKSEMSKSQSVLNNHHDEELEISQSGSDQSVDTVGSSPGRHHHPKGSAPTHAPNATATASIPQMSAAQKAAASQLNTQDSPPVNRKGNASGSMQVRKCSFDVIATFPSLLSADLSLFHSFFRSFFCSLFLILTPAFFIFITRSLTARTRRKTLTGRMTTTEMERTASITSKERTMPEITRASTWPARCAICFSTLSVTSPTKCSSRRHCGASFLIISRPLESLMHSSR